MDIFGKHACSRKGVENSSFETNRKRRWGDKSDTPVSQGKGKKLTKAAWRTERGVRVVKGGENYKFKSSFWTSSIKERKTVMCIVVRRLPVVPENELDSLKFSEQQRAAGSVWISAASLDESGSATCLTCSDEAVDFLVCVGATTVKISLPSYNSPGFSCLRLMC